MRKKGTSAMRVIKFSKIGAHSRRTKDHRASLKKIYWFYFTFGTNIVELCGEEAVTGIAEGCED